MVYAPVKSLFGHGQNNKLYAEYSGICVKEFQLGAECSANNRHPGLASKVRHQSSALKAAAVFVPSS
jgi:hypothetical protein